MSGEMIRDMLLWCLLMNMGMLLVWFAFLSLAHDWVYRVHSKWFKISVEQFDAIHYAGIAILKTVIFVFNVVPYLALLIVL